MKPIRKAVRTYLFKDNKIMAIKYITEECFGYYDVPGGKIEEGETPEQAAIREFKEETGIEISNPMYAGNMIAEYPNRIFDLEIFVVYSYKGEPITTEENESAWMDIEELLKQEKTFPAINMLNNKHFNELINKTNFKFHFITDQNHKIIDEKG
jgi:mutator protein MutT